jgi:hypothetical protein
MESECKTTCMDLGVKQSRRFYLAGAVAFPTPFPSAGAISIEEGSLLLSGETDRPNGGEKKEKEANGEKRERMTFVVVQEMSRIGEATIRIFRKSDVAAIFFPGFWVDTDKGKVFKFSRRNHVHDLEKGEWFLGPHVKASKITSRLKLDQSNIDIADRDSPVRGMVFVPEHLPVLTVYECAQASGDAALDIEGHCFGPAMETVKSRAYAPALQRVWGRC